MSFSEGIRTLYGGLHDGSFSEAETAADIDEALAEVRLARRQKA